MTNWKNSLVTHLTIKKKITIEKKCANNKSSSQEKEKRQKREEVFNIISNKINAN